MPNIEWKGTRCKCKQHNLKFFIWFINLIILVTITIRVITVIIAFIYEKVKQSKVRFNLNSPLGCKSLFDRSDYLPLYQASIYTILILKAILPLLNSYLQTLGEAILMATMIGARDVLMTCDGWLMVSQSNTTSCELRHSSKIRFTSSWTSTVNYR